MLCDTYENKKLIVMSLIRIIRTLNPIGPNDINDLRHVTLKFNQVIRSLHSIGVTTDTWDPILVYDLNALLDNDTRQQWELKHASTEVPKLADMMLFLQ